MVLPLLFRFVLFGQDLTSKQLQGFSYLIFGFTDMKYSSGNYYFNIKQGTCFFIRSNNRTYLVSAKHAITPWNGDISKKEDTFPDTLMLRLFDSVGKIVLCPIDIREMKDKVDGGYFYDDPDVYIFEFKEAGKFKVNTIDNFNQNFNDSMVEVVSYGYPNIKLVPGNMDIFLEQKPTLTAGKTIKKNSINRLPVSEKNNNTSYAILRTDTLPKKGCSGSPVFYRRDSLDNWKFGGVFVRSSEEVPISTIVKPEYLQTILNRLK